MRGYPGRLVTEQNGALGRLLLAPRSIQLVADLAAEERHELVELEVGREAGGALVAAAALLAGDRGDVDRAAARAQADLAGGPAAVAEVADQGGDLAPSTERRWSMIPSVISSPAPVAS